MPRKDDWVNRVIHDVLEPERQMDRTLRQLFRPIQEDINRITAMFRARPTISIGEEVRSLRRGRGIIIGMTDSQVRVKWPDSSETWERKRDLGRPQ